MHSWTGNLVTNRNFEHFWLNEGFTVFLERKVNDDLKPTNPLTRLVVELKGVHPDDAFSTVPYEKGSLFLRYLEDLLGGPEVFDDFLRSYLNKFARKSLDTDQFKAYLLDYFKDNDKLKAVDWNAWLYTSGMPPILDASNLTIESVELEDGTSLEYVLDEPVPNYGSKFTITLPKISSSGEK
ncbi:hypothetical protein MSG28_008551 [Choristoneura fumiferana]|uniref:Uncharacterized protein n=1 Tax=Choristoneura fumiferana TaxID=7141 RepID=A0ACC0J757_CHOFU|nr:hypothetical protein MSG28_008551 [Choristoneura fumiferana]